MRHAACSSHICIMVASDAAGYVLMEVGLDVVGHVDTRWRVCVCVGVGQTPTDHGGWTDLADWRRRGGDRMTFAYLRSRFLFAAGRREASTTCVLCPRTDKRSPMNSPEHSLYYYTLYPALVPRPTRDSPEQPSQLYSHIASQPHRLPHNPRKMSQESHSTDTEHDHRWQEDVHRRPEVQASLGT